MGSVLDVGRRGCRAGTRYERAEHHADDGEREADELRGGTVSSVVAHSAMVQESSPNTTESTAPGTLARFQKMPAASGTMHETSVTL